MNAASAKCLAIWGVTPRCHSLSANDGWYSLGALAYNILGDLKLLVLPERDLAKRPQTVMQRLLLLPREIKRRARQIKAVVYICHERMIPWQKIFEVWMPDHWLTRAVGRSVLLYNSYQEPP